MPSSKNDQIKLRAFAKINLSLKVLGKRDDGYHDIDSVMQSVSLHDEIIIKTTDAGIVVNCSEPGIKNNIAQKAAELLLKESKVKAGVYITIKKNIPVASGMGGGSANAAAVLTGLNALFNLNFHRDKLMEIAVKLGADVPFCLVGGTARCLGVGDKIEKVNPKTGSAFLLVVPRIQVPTKDVYNRYDEIGAGDSDNELERSAFDLFPKIKEFKETLDIITEKRWKMSGSGPALYLELADLSESEKFLPMISNLGSVNHLVKRMDAGVEQF